MDKKKVKELIQEVISNNVDSLEFGNDKHNAPLRKANSLLHDVMVKPYRIKHKASGYFYQRYNGSNLGKKGKVYMNNQSPLTMCDNENFIRIQIRHNTLAYKVLRDMLSKYVIGKDDEYEWHSTSYRVPKSEFEKEEL